MLARRTDGTTGTTRAVAYFVSVGSHLVLTTHLIEGVDDASDVAARTVAQQAVAAHREHEAAHQLLHTP